jgi:hypothetical protein
VPAALERFLIWLASEQSRRYRKVCSQLFSKMLYQADFRRGSLYQGDHRPACFELFYSYGIIVLLREISITDTT